MLRYCVLIAVVTTWAGPAIAQQTIAYPLWDTSKTYVVGQPFTPEVEVIDMPCMCPVNQSSDDATDSCMFRVVPLNSDGSEAEGSAKVSGSLVWLKRGRTYALGSHRGKIVDPVNPLVFDDAGRYSLRLTVNCPQPSDLPILHPSSQMWRGQWRWNISVVQATTKPKYPSNPFGCTTRPGGRACM